MTSTITTETSRGTEEETPPTATISPSPAPDGTASPAEEDDDQSEAAGAASAWAPLRAPVFRALWLAAMVSNIGFWMQNVGAVWLMGSQTGSALLISLVQTAMTLPIVLMALPAGAMADVLDLRRMLLTTQGWMALSAAALTGLTLLNSSPPWVLLALTFMLGIGNAANAPAWQAVLPHLVRRSHLSGAVALNSAQFNVGRAVGPAIGGLVVAAAGPVAVFALNAVSFVGVLAVLYRWRGTPPKPHDGQPVLSAVGAGLRYLRGAPALQAVLTRTGLFVLPASALWALLPVVARDRLGMTSAQFGLLFACIGVGSVLGVAVLPKLRQWLGIDVRVALGSGLFALALLVLALVPNAVAVSAAMVVTGLAWVTLLTSLNVATRARVPDWVQARALAGYILVFQGGLAVGAMLWGTVAGLLGAPSALLAAALLLAAGELAGRRWPLRTPVSASTVAAETEETGETDERGETGETGERAPRRIPVPESWRAAA